MRHNQNGRRYRGRGNNNGGGGGGGHSNHHHNNGGGGNNNRRVNPRVQTFDSNGPEVRIRGNAYQINEKYLALAKDASSAGDRILAESYLQHAEHYQRMINEMTEEYNRHNPQPQFQPNQHQQGGEDHQQPAMDAGEGDQPMIDGDLADLDQGFLVGPRHGKMAQAKTEQSKTEAASPEAVQAETTQREGRRAKAVAES